MGCMLEVGGERVEGMNGVSGRLVWFLCAVLWGFLGAHEFWRRI
jgi:hypothetical protein